MPCYSSLDHFLSPPAVPISGYQTPISIPLTALTSTTSSTSSGKPTSAVVNVVYAIQYPLASSQGLSTGAKAGIGAGAGIGALAIIGLVGVLIWRTKKHSRDKRAFAAAQAPAPGSTAGLGPISGPDSTVGQSQSFMSSVSPQQSAQTHNNFLPQETYFPPPQMQQLQQGFPPQKNYDQQPVQYIPQGWSQPNIQYSGTLSSSISLPPSSNAAYGHQSGCLCQSLCQRVLCLRPSCRPRRSMYIANNLILFL